MAIDWNALVGSPLQGVFGGQVLYTPGPASPMASTGAFLVSGVFDEAYTPVDATNGDYQVISAAPILGVQAADFPAGFDPERTQGDVFTLDEGRGKSYVVKAGKADGLGGVTLEANEA